MGVSQVKVEFLGDASQLKRATGQAETSLQKFKKAGAAAFGGTALGGLSKGGGYAAAAVALVSVIEKTTKAYYEDVRAQETLALSMRNAGVGTRSQISDTETFIEKLQRQTAIMDDELRPAMAVFIRSTKDVAKSQELLQLATDVSAGTGKDLATVSNALAKAYNGQYTSLNKLIPGISAAKDPMAELRTQFDGMAEAAAEKNPFARMQVAFAELQESLGGAFAPLIEELANLVASDEFKKIMDVLIFITKMQFKPLTLLFKILSPILSLLEPVFKLLEVIFLAIEWGAKKFENWFKVISSNKTVGLVFEALLAPLKFVNDLLDKALKLLGEADATEYGPSTADVVGQELQRREDEQRKKADAKRKAAVTAASQRAKELAQQTAERLKNAAEIIRDGGKAFKDALNLSFGLSENGDFFSVEPFLAQTRKIVQAAKELPAKLKALRKAGATEEVIQNIVAQGPLAGNAIATGFLQQGGVKEYAASLATLNTAGQQATVQGNANYSININKANMTAEEIIRVIQQYEKKTGRQVTF